MKEMFESNAYLSKLAEFVKSKISHRSEALIKRQQRRNSPPSTSSMPLGKEQQDVQDKRAATTIQRFWRLKKLKDAMLISPYAAYLSLVNPDDSQRLLSELMFGRHIAEIGKKQIGHIDNVYIHDEMYYHRADEFKGAVVDLLLKEFGLQFSEDDDYVRSLPISLLRIADVELMIDEYCPNALKFITLIKDAEHSVAILKISKDANQKQVEHIKTLLSSLGLVASPWEMATNIKHLNIERSKSVVSKRSEHLPKTKEALLQSRFFGALNMLASSDRHSTHLLSKSLKKMLENAPELSADAVERIALMLDITNTFYANNYSRYAFCVYTIIHEISLSLLDQTDSAQLKKEYTAFCEESVDTIYKAFGLSEDDVVDCELVASPALSGTNAYIIAQQLTSAMQTESGEAATVNLIEPFYYEFDFTTNKTDSPNADVLVISSGPIITLDGLTPGVDINLFVRHHIIDTHRTKPTTVIIDATTGLYSNLKLDDDVKALVRDGSLSIIVMESHQKFGLIHSDQAQYGRVFGVCSPKSFQRDVLLRFIKCSKADFLRHIDMRIGAFISSHCGAILEEIKKQHFINGAIFRNMLIEAEEAGVRYINTTVVIHDDMLTNFDELFFSLLKQNSQDYTPLGELAIGRDSFGHYSTTYTGMLDLFRLSPGASDEIDSLITAAQFCLKLSFESAQTLVSLIPFKIQNDEPLSLEHQILALAMLNFYILDTQWDTMTSSLTDRVAEISGILNECPLLKGRESYLLAQGHLLNLQQQARVISGAARGKSSFFTTTATKKETSADQKISPDKDDAQKDDLLKH